MIVVALDTSTLSRMLTGIDGPDTMKAREYVDRGEAALSPVVLAEAFSDPKLPPDQALRILQMPLLRITQGYWLRAGHLRRALLAKRRKAGLADCLVAQSCIDENIPLITFDDDFRHFVAAGLHLM